MHGELPRLTQRAMFGSMAGWRFTTPTQERDRLEREGRLPPPHDWRAGLRFLFSRQPYTGNNRVVLLQLVVTVAIGVMALINLFAWARHGGGWVAAASCITFVAVMAYPYVRHRLERGYWPD